MKDVVLKALFTTLRDQTGAGPLFISVLDFVGNMGIGLLRNGPFFGCLDYLFIVFFMSCPPAYIECTCDICPLPLVRLLSIPISLFAYKIKKYRSHFHSSELIRIISSLVFRF